MPESREQALMIPLAKPNPTSKIRLLKAVIKYHPGDSDNSGDAVYEIEVYNTGDKGYCHGGAPRWRCWGYKGLRVRILTDTGDGYAVVKVPRGQTFRVLTEHLGPWPPEPVIYPKPWLERAELM